eukprot:CAMPEP_0119355958 /NCGR_PEP_ID=MMETSP1334-20130426/4711_1 /TAXON_ID=127549 /ORGANISM="Calcidiscus leptoporus, Strain RCC1130" /LENGTH=108 /DNA_ID=CAMNT_0007369907 /DNA_START=567 /DNA_END=889 /DNA_ORIENTATION=+
MPSIDELEDLAGEVRPVVFEKHALPDLDIADGLEVLERLVRLLPAAHVLQLLAQVDEVGDHPIFLQGVYGADRGGRVLESYSHANLNLDERHRWSARGLRARRGGGWV